MLTFRVDLPPADLSPNRVRNIHWTLKSKAVQDYRALVGATGRNAAAAAKWQAPYLGRVSMCWHLLDKRPPWLKKADPRYKPMDCDNAISASKACFDGMVDAGLLMNDTWDHMEIGRIWSTKESGPYCVVTIEAVVGMNGLGI